MWEQAQPTNLFLTRDNHRKENLIICEAAFSYCSNKQNFGSVARRISHDHIVYMFQYCLFFVDAHKNTNIARVARRTISRKNMYSFKDPRGRTSTSITPTTRTTRPVPDYAPATTHSFSPGGATDSATTPGFNDDDKVRRAPQTSVSSDMAAWKATVQAERQRRLIASQKREAVSQQRRRDPVRGSHDGYAMRDDSAAEQHQHHHQFETADQHRTVSKQQSTLSFSEYRSAILATRPAGELVSTIPSSRSASRDSGKQQVSLHQQRQPTPQRDAPRRAAHAGSSSPSPITIPHKWIDPMDVEYRPARSVVRQYREQEPSPYFVRKNVYGSVDQYTDHAASTHQRQGESSLRDRSSSQQREVVVSRPINKSSVIPLRPYKEPRAVWREAPAVGQYDFPTPRSTTLRNQHIAQRRRALEAAPDDALYGRKPRSSSLSSERQVDRSSRGPPKPYVRTNSATDERRSVVRPGSKDARLVGAPSPRPTGTAPISERLISPHHNGARELKSRRQGGGFGDDSIERYDGFEDDELDPVPLAFAPSPKMQRDQSSSLAHSSLQMRNAVSSPPSRRQASPHQQPRPYFPGSSNDAHHNEASPGVDVSPPTPYRPAEYQHFQDPTDAADTSLDTPLRHNTSLTLGGASRENDISRDLLEGSQRDRAASVNASRETSKPWSVPQPMVLPTMRSQRVDLFQGLSASGGAVGGGHEGSAAGPASLVGNLRHSSIHDRLEQDLVARRNGRSSPQRFFSAALGDGGTEELSTSRTLLRDLATKRVPR
jgi:hypothetical protein